MYLELFFVGLTNIKTLFFRGILHSHDLNENEEAMVLRIKVWYHLDNQLCLGIISFPFVTYKEAVCSFMICGCKQGASYVTGSSEESLLFY